MASGRGATTCDHWTWLKLPDQRLGPGSSTTSSFTVTGLLKNLANLKIRKSWLTFDIIFCSKSLEVMVARRLKLSIGALDLDKVYSRRRLASHWHDWLAPLIAYNINLWSYELTQKILYEIYSSCIQYDLWSLCEVSEVYSWQACTAVFEFLEHYTWLCMLPLYFLHEKSFTTTIIAPHNGNANPSIGGFLLI